jgi:hypothetical protein
MGNGPIALRGSWQGNSFMVRVQSLTGRWFDLSFDFDEAGVEVQLLAPWGARLRSALQS